MSALVAFQMWKYEGQKTLSYYLKRRDCLEVLSEDLGVDKSAVVATIMKQILEGIAVSIAYAFAEMLHRFRLESGRVRFAITAFHSFQCMAPACI